MILPEHSSLDISKLSSIFRDTTNSYKFYWFLSILDSLKNNNQSIISQQDMAIRMLANVWYPLDYYKLSFGKQDSFKKIAQFVSSKIRINNKPNSPTLFEQIKAQFSENELHQLSIQISDLTRYVPYRFVRPFFSIETRSLPDFLVENQIVILSNQYFSSEPHRVIYRFLGKEAIELNDIWIDYFQKHQTILRGFIYWHLVNFLQKNNPNVIGLSEKLQKPTSRQRDLTSAHKFWREFLIQHPQTTCIYSGNLLNPDDLSLDHFLPWSYVVHNQLWNLIPTSRSLNSAKNDWLPSLEMYFERFVRLQYQIMRHYANQKKWALLEDYTYISNESLENMSLESFQNVLSKQIFPQWQTAQHLGFAHPFVYKNGS